MQSPLQAFTGWAVRWLGWLASGQVPPSLENNPATIATTGALPHAHLVAHCNLFMQPLQLPLDFRRLQRSHAAVADAPVPPLAGAPRAQLLVILQAEA